MQKEFALGLAVIGLSIFDLIITSVSLGIKYWYYADTDLFKTHIGLWRGCFEVKIDRSLDDCRDVRGTDEQKAVRAMVFLGLFFVCGGLACIVMKMFMLKDQKALLYAATGIYFLGGLFLMIGFAVYDAEILQPTKDTIPESKPHASFALCIIAWLVTWIAAGLSAGMAFIKESKVDGEKVDI